jgi:hypothetical protein
VLATLPLFVALGVVRLLVVALPEAVVASPLFIVHAFYHLLLGAVVVFFTALWRHGRKTALHRACAGVIVGVLFVCVLGPFYSRAVTYATGPSPEDPQGALAFLPPFQVGLYLALWVAAFIAVGWKRFLMGLAALSGMQVAGLLALNALASHAGLTTHVRDLRGWAVAGPLFIATVVVYVGIHGARPSR